MPDWDKTSGLTSHTVKRQDTHQSTSRENFPRMQSFFQYRRFKRHLERQIKERGIKATASAQDDFPCHEIRECADDTARGRRAEGSEDRTEAENDGNVSSNQPTNTITSPINGQHQVLTGIQPAETTASIEKAEERVFIVGFQGSDDPLSPYNWSRTRKWIYTFIVGSTGFIVSGASAFDTEITAQAAKAFGVSQEVELLSTSLYMIALGLGSLVSAPFSETVGRNPVYIICELSLPLTRSSNSRLTLTMTMAQVWQSTPCSSWAPRSPRTSKPNSSAASSPLSSAARPSQPSAAAWQTCGCR